MDGQRFDSVAKLIAQGKSRRGVLKALGGTITAGLFGVSFKADALAGCGICDNGQVCYRGSCCSLLDDGEVCISGNECCGGFCPGGFCNSCESGSACDGECCSGHFCDQETFTCQLIDDCSPIEGNCDVNGDCCGDAVCNGFFQCTDSCGINRASCETGADCCVLHTCLETGAGKACVANESCLIEGDPCQIAGALIFSCCEGLSCIDSVCTELCIAEGEACGNAPSGDLNLDCCGDLACIDDLCAEAAAECTAENDACESDEECCTGICCGGACHDIECCTDDILTGGNPNDRCPEGTACFEGYCDAIGGEEEPEAETPVVLPNTGAALARSAKNNRTEVTGVLAGLGAAALILGKKLRA